MTEIFVYIQINKAQEPSTFSSRNFIWLSTLIDIIIVLFRVVSLLGFLTNVVLRYDYLKSC